MASDRERVDVEALVWALNDVACVVEAEQVQAIGAERDAAERLLLYWLSGIDREAAGMSSLDLDHATEAILTRAGLLPVAADREG